MPGAASLARLGLRSRTSATATIPTTTGWDPIPSSTSLRPISSQTLLPAGAVGPGVTSLAVIAKGTVAGASIRLLSVPACGVPLGLIAISETALILACTRTILLIRSRPVLLIDRLVPAARLLTVVLSKVSAVIVLGLIPTIVLVLGLIAVLIEFRLGEVSVAAVVIEIVRAVIDVVAVDVIHVIAIDVIDVVTVDVVDVGGIDVIAVVIVIAVDEGVGIGDVDVAVITHSRVMPANSPRVISPSAASSAIDRCADSHSNAERNQAGGDHCAG